MDFGLCCNKKVVLIYFLCAILIVGMLIEIRLRRNCFVKDRKK